MNCFNCPKLQKGTRLSGSNWVQCTTLYRCDEKPTEVFRRNLAQSIAKDNPTCDGKGYDEDD